MTSRTFIACDPGRSGAIAYSNRSGVASVKMPETTEELAKLLMDIIKADTSGRDIIIGMEKVGSYIPGGGASMMFQYGRNVERLACVIEMIGLLFFQTISSDSKIQLINLPPQTWQRELNLGKSERVAVPKPPKGLSKQQVKVWAAENFAEVKAAEKFNDEKKREWKNKLKDHAASRFASIKVTLANCDALLMLDVIINREAGEPTLF